MSINLYSILTAYGSVYETTHKLDRPADFVRWTEEKFEYVKYNTRKSIDRYGLSITSLDGGLSGVPDLDSLIEYNKENNTSYRESDFKTFTPVYEHEGLNFLLKPIERFIFRTHVLKMNPGGYFPPHRDFKGTNFDSFRLIVPLENIKPPAFNFILEDRILHWNVGSLYFLDTAKMHYLFNASFSPSYMIVVNVSLHEESVNFILRHLKHC